ncbi:ABC transporter substrate-binding protein [Bradyrhizobium sp. 1.29L]
MKRRDVLTGALKLGAALSLSAPFVGPRRAQAAGSVTLVSWGGSWGDLVKEVLIRPFTAETGISVEYLTGPDLARVKAQVATNNIEWDIVDLSGPAIYAGANQGLWEPIDQKILDPSRFVAKPPPFAAPVGYQTLGIAYDPSRTKQPAQDFGQLWDVKNFPGRRALISYHANELLEGALLGDGVAPKELYPLDIDRAFRALERIKPYVKRWFAETAQGITLLQTNEADYTLTYVNRAKAAKESGASISFSRDQCILTVEYFAVVKGTQRKEAAMRFLEFATRPDRQALISNKTAGIPSAKGAKELMDQEAKRWSADLDNPKNVITDNQYWGDHFVELDKRFKEWLLT